MFRTSLATTWQHKRRLAASAFAVILGVAFLTGTLVIGDSAKAGFHTVFTDANAHTDAVVRNATDLASDDGPRAPIDAALVDRIAALEGVAAVAPRVQGVAQILDADGNPIGGDGPPTIGANWITDPALADYRLAEGRAPIGPGEVVIDRTSARSGDLAPGDTTTVLTPEPVVVDVVGVATFGDRDSLGGTTLAAFDLTEAQQLFLGDTTDVSSVLVNARPGVSQAELVDEIRPHLPEGVEVISGATLTAEQQQAVENDFLGFFTTGLQVFAVIALIVAAFSIFNTFSVLAAQRTRESALLRAIGASRSQVLGAEVIEAFLVGSLGAALGIAGGLGIARGLQEVLGDDGMGLPVDGLVVTATTLALAAAVGILITVAAALIPGVRAARVAPVAVLRETAVDAGTGSHWRTAAGSLLGATGVGSVLWATTSGAMPTAGAGALALVLALVLLGPIAVRPVGTLLGRPLRWLGVSGDLAGRNAVRNPRRTASTAAALCVGISVVTLFTVFGASIKASMTTAVDTSFSGDLVVQHGGFSGVGLSPEMTRRLRALPEVDHVATLGFPEVDIDGRPTQVTATDIDDFLAVADPGLGEAGPSGDLTTTFGATRKTADARGWSIGDPVPVSFADGATADLRLGFVYSDTSIGGDVLLPSAVVTPHESQPSDRIALIALASGVSPDRGRQAVESVTGEFGYPDVQDRDEFLASQSAQIDLMLNIVYGLLAVAILIAAMGIANTMSLSLHERTRELGLLRAMGQSRRDLRSMIRWESVIVSSFGALGGIGLGMFLGWAMIRALSVAEGFGTVAFPVFPLAVIFAAGAGIGVLASLRPAHRAARMHILDAIATD